MTTLASLFIAAATVYLFYLLVKIAGAGWRQDEAIKNGKMLSARIVRVEVMDDENRLVPFVKLQVEVNGEETIICSAEGFYKRTELCYLQVGNFVSAVLDPTDQKKVLLVKAQVTLPKPNQTTNVLSIPPKRKLSVA